MRWRKIQTEGLCSKALQLPGGRISKQIPAQDNVWNLVLIMQSCEWPLVQEDGSYLRGLFCIISLVHSSVQLTTLRAPGCTVECHMYYNK